MIEPVINFLLPNSCISCNKILKTKSQICIDCFNKLNFISAPYCSKCGRPFVDGSASRLCALCVQNKDKTINLSRSVFLYDEISKKMILEFKFYDKTQNSKAFGKWLELASKDIINHGVDLIIPVPLHFIRLIKRKYNQAALLAKELGKKTHIKVNYHSLCKKRYTKPQTKFLGIKRRRNVRNSFIIKNPSQIKDKRILLIDDVMTTGSTIKECAKTLIKAGAKEVNVLTLARVL